jgi:hypothetical protein
MKQGLGFQLYSIVGGQKERAHTHTTQKKLASVVLIQSKRVDFDGVTQGRGEVGGVARIRQVKLETCSQQGDQLRTLF